MDETKVRQESEQVYETLKHSGRCNFSSLCSMCQMDNQSICNALILLCRQDKVRQEWDDEGIWYSILTNNRCL